MSEPVPAKRGRKPDPIYGKLVELFVEGGSEVSEIDWRAMGREPGTVQHGLTAAIKRLDLDDAIRVSLLDGGGEGSPTPTHGATESVEVRDCTARGGDPECRRVGYRP